MSNYEAAVRVPLLVRLPGQVGNTALNCTVHCTLQVSPRTLPQFVSLVDLLPSLAELAGLETVPACRPATTRATQTCTEGRSWAGLLDSNPGPAWQDLAFSQYPRPARYPQQDSDLPRERDIRYMGYSARWREAGAAGGWRCTAWLGWRWNSTPHTNPRQLAGLELYDHTADPAENYNLSGEKRYAGILARCLDLLLLYIQNL